MMWLIIPMAFFFVELEKSGIPIDLLSSLCNPFNKSIVLRGFNEEIGDSQRNEIVKGKKGRKEISSMNSRNSLSMFNDPLFPYQWHLVRYFFLFIV